MSASLTVYAADPERLAAIYRAAGLPLVRLEGGAWGADVTLRLAIEPVRHPHPPSRLRLRVGDLAHVR